MMRLDTVIPQRKEILTLAKIYKSRETLLEFAESIFHQKLAILVISGNKDKIEFKSIACDSFDFLVFKGCLMNLIV